MNEMSAPLQLRPLAAQHEEARPRQPNAALEVRYPQRLRYVPVRLRLEVEFGRLTHRLHRHVRRLVSAHRRSLVRYVRNPQQQRVQFLVRRAQTLLQLPDSPADLAHLLDELLRTLFRAAQFPAHLVASGPQFVSLGYDGAPFAVQFDYAVYRNVGVPLSHRLFDGFRVPADKLDCYHGMSFTSIDGR